MAKPRKGVVPPQLRRFLFKKGHGARLSKVVHTAKKGRRGRKVRSGHAALPVIPTLVMMSPEIMAGVHGLADAASGLPPAQAGGLALMRLQSLYGGRAAESTTFYGIPVSYGLKENVTAKALGAIIHLIARKTGMRGHISKRMTLL